jgi:hypothetical protein
MEPGVLVGVAGIVANEMRATLIPGGMLIRIAVLDHKMADVGSGMREVEVHPRRLFVEEDRKDQEPELPVGVPASLNPQAVGSVIPVVAVLALAYGDTVARHFGQRDGKRL